MARRSFLAKIAPGALLLGLILTGALAIYGTRPPPAADASAAIDVFSAARAMTHLEHIAKYPHPIGSDENTRVRKYLVDQLRALGGEVHVEQSTNSCRTTPTSRR
jgi:hypothetical protein